MGGGQGKVIYLDTEGNFRPERIEQISGRFGLDAEDTLDNIVICRVYTSEEQNGTFIIYSNNENNRQHDEIFILIFFLRNMYINIYYCNQYYTRNIKISSCIII